MSSCVSRGLFAAAAFVLAFALQAPAAHAEGKTIGVPEVTIRKTDPIEVVEDASDEQSAGEGQSVDDGLIETYYMDENGDTHTVRAQPVTQANARYFPSSPNGWCVVTQDIVVRDRVEAAWDKVIIADGVTATINGGIEVKKGRSLDVYGQSESGGTLVCHGSSANSCPGIGGSCVFAAGGNIRNGYGDINFHSGTVIADGASETAGIGCGLGCTDNGTINIYGGDITATAGGDGRYGDPSGAAGIGGSRGGDCGAIRIFGGKVNATGACGAAGIGCGFKGKGGTVEIHGGTVVANGGEEGQCDALGGAGIGCGSKEESVSTATKIDMSVTIDGGTVEAYGHDGGAGIGGGYGCGINGVAITGGNVTAKGLFPASWVGPREAGVGSGRYGGDTPITLGWSNEGDTLTTNAFVGQVSVVEGQALTSDEHEATIMGENVAEDKLEKLRDKTLRGAAKCTITWDFDGNSEPKAQEVFEGEVIRMPQKPSDLPKDVCRFKGWLVGDKVMQPDQVYTVEGDMTIKISLVYDGHRLCIDPELRGIVEADGDNPSRGKQVHLTANLPWGKRFKGGAPIVEAADGTAHADVTKTDEPNVYVFKMIDRDANVRGELEDIPNIEPVFGREHLSGDGTLGLVTTVELLREEGLDWSGSYMEFAVDGKASRTVKVPLDQAVKRDADKPECDAYAFTCPLSSIELAQNVTATFHYGDGRTVERSGLSMQECIKAAIGGAMASDGTYGPFEMILAHAVANYGYYAQRFLIATKGEKALADYATIEQRYTREDGFTKSAALEKVSGYDTKSNTKNSAIKKMGCSLEFGSEIALNLTVTVPKGTKVEGEASFQDRTFRFEKASDTTYRVRVTGIRLHELDRPITVTGKADGDFSVELSALSYLNKVLTTSAYGVEGDCVSCALLQCYDAVSAMNRG